MKESEWATLGAGCFWGVQHLIDRIPGVLGTTCGYMGGVKTDPTYQEVCAGDTGHIEVVQIEFDPERLAYPELLSYFWRLHDPTQLNRQGVDVGTQYRSVIFYHSERQRQEAEMSRDKFDASGVFEKKAVTEIVRAGTFYSAEEYHQKYYDRNGGHVCQVLRRE